MMIKQIVTTVAAIALASGIALGQQEPGTAQAERKPEAAPAAPRSAGLQANIRIDLTITEQRGGTALPARTITMMIADREVGRVRTGQGNSVMNADVRPEILSGGRVRVMLSLEYRRQQEETEKMPPALLTQSMATILEDGKPLLVSQSADPGTTPGGVRVEVKATISR